MDIVRHLGSVLVQGSETALRAYTKASDAYAENLLAPSVAVWSVGIAVGLVLLEFVVTWRRRAE